jgi:hypothetical protein
MAFAADYDVLHDRLEDELRFAPRPTPGLFAKIIGGACSRIAHVSNSENATQIERLIQSNAWTDAALALIDLELPAWTLRRLVCEGDEWICSLSRKPNLPVSLDDTLVEATHKSMPLAVVLAFLQARRSSQPAWTVVSAIRGLHSATDALVCCDNFA